MASSLLHFHDSLKCAALKGSSCSLQHISNITHMSISYEQMLLIAYGCCHCCFTTGSIPLPLLLPFTFIKLYANIQ